MITTWLPRVRQDVNEMSMAITHVQMLYALLQQGFARTLEIGSHKGVSSIAFLSALEDGYIQHADFCDVDFCPEFHRLIRFAPKHNINLYQTPSVTVINAIYDFIFVDGNHSLENVRQETELIIAAGIPHVAAHDTHCEPALHPNCDGPAYLVRTLVENGYELVVDDWDARDGERTEVGFSYLRKL